ncbi:hypothetical protein GcC1_139020 [Golovinomyces cichoracearum]|uniref:Uncharacterized protein n=1 Tax=Golovinomyces cichoracearum TaxID=62708 RepID=A0A420I104_9PEZI|nr:hypothetical protein GcC1_139020 [Golovinomyces cichoracearum]
MVGMATENMRGVSTEREFLGYGRDSRRASRAGMSGLWLSVIPDISIYTFTKIFTSHKYSYNLILPASRTSTFPKNIPNEIILQESAPKTLTKRNPTSTPNKPIKSNHWSDPKIKDKINKDVKFKSNIRGPGPIEGHKGGDDGIESVVRALVYLREDEQLIVREGIDGADDKGVAVLEGNVHDLLPILGNKEPDEGVEVLDNLENKSMDWFVKVRAFIDSQMCQYVSHAASSKKFPAVNIPSTNPGLDILYLVMASDFEEADYVPIKLGLRLPVKGKDRLPVLLGKGGEGDKESRCKDKGLGGAEDEGRVLRKPRSREVLWYTLIVYPQF